MKDNLLRERHLPAAFIINNFVTNESECNYEIYLTELINHSALFLEKSHQSKYKWVPRQDHGECDAVSDHYSIDYKLLAATSMLQGIRETSLRITKVTDGFFAYSRGRLPIGQTILSLRIVSALKSFSIEQFDRIAEYPNDRLESEISTVLKSLRTQKNLLLFYPCELFLSEPCSFSTACDLITAAFNQDLHCICVYRKKKASEYDTYLSVIYDKQLLIYEECSFTWLLKDHIPLNLSKTYMSLDYKYGNHPFH